MQNDIVVKPPPQSVSPVRSGNQEPEVSPEPQSDNQLKQPPGSPSAGGQLSNKDSIQAADNVSNVPNDGKKTTGQATSDKAPKSAAATIVHKKKNSSPVGVIIFAVFVCIMLISAAIYSGYTQSAP